MTRGRALACWINALDIEPGVRKHHFGCGVGYYTAIAAETARAEGSFVGSEVNPQLASRSERHLSADSHGMVHTWMGAEFDPVPATASLSMLGLTHPLPLWLDHLRDGEVWSCL